MAKSTIPSKSVSDNETNGLFSKRDEALRLLGFESYADYLQSDLWDWIRSNLKNEPASNECYCCRSKTGLSWHHKCYSLRVLVGNFSNCPAVVVRLCRECHYAIHREGEKWLERDVVDSRLMELKTRGDINDIESQGRSGLMTKAWEEEEF